MELVRLAEDRLVARRRARTRSTCAPVDTAGNADPSPAAADLDDRLSAASGHHPPEHLARHRRSAWNRDHGLGKLHLHVLRGGVHIPVPAGLRRICRLCLPEGLLGPRRGGAQLLRACSRRGGQPRPDSRTEDLDGRLPGAPATSATSAASARTSRRVRLGIGQRLEPVHLRGAVPVAGPRLRSGRGGRRGRRGGGLLPVADDSRRARRPSSSRAPGCRSSASSTAEPRT